MTLLREAIPDPPGEWVADALCGSLVRMGHDPDWWHPQPRKVSDDNKAAMRLCMDCPVRMDCLDYAHRWRLTGIWGGAVLRHRHDAPAAVRRPYAVG